MSINLYSKVGEMEYDGLITDLTPPVQVRGGTIAHGVAAAEYVRGTIMAKDGSGKLHIFGTNAPGTVTESFNGDGSTKKFTLTADVAPLFLDGVKVGTSDATIKDYNPQTKEFELASAPAAGTKNVVASYQNPEGDVPDCILCDNIAVGTTTDEKTSVYTAGCFDPEKCTVAEGYTLTTADKDALRMRGIVFKAAKAAD